MHEIAIGVAGSINIFTVIHGPGLPAPAFKATCFFNFSAEPFVSEFIELELKGTSAQIETFIRDLQLYFHYGALTQDGVLNAPLVLRFQRESGGSYLYAFLLNPYLAANPGSYIRQSQGSKQITIHYTRPNYFQGDKTVLPVLGLFSPVSPVLENYHLYNHTYDTVDSTVWVDPSSFSSSLPAPLRIEVQPLTASISFTHFFIGLTHHRQYNTFDAFFYYHDTISSSGTVHANGSAIAGKYISLSITPSTWTAAFTIALSSLHLSQLSGQLFRPILRFFTPHAYDDLFFRLAVIANSVIIHTSEAVYSPPGTGYLLLPSVNLPPGPLLNESPPQALSLQIQAFRESGSATTLTTDYLTLFPFHPGAIFPSFFPVKTDSFFIEDSAFARHGFRDTFNSGESVSHSRIGPPLVVYPQQINRLFFAIADGNNILSPNHLSLLKVFYYPRYALL
jgi:hypothetical protein